MPSLILPYPPSANRYWRIFRGHHVPSAAAKAYREAVWAIAAQAGLRSQFMGGVVLELVLRPLAPKDAERRERLIGPDWHWGVRCIDADNALKICLDALQGVAYANDNQIRKITIERGEPCFGGALEITWEKTA